MKSLTVHCIAPFKAWALKIAILATDQMPLPFIVTEAESTPVIGPGLSLKPWTFHCKDGRRAGTEREGCLPKVFRKFDQIFGISAGHLAAWIESQVPERWCGRTKVSAQARLLNKALLLLNNY